MIGKPDETESTLDALLATTFVTRVDRATLSVIAPLLSKCLKSRQSNMHRKAGMVRSKTLPRRVFNSGIGEPGNSMHGGIYLIITALVIPKEGSKASLFTSLDA